MTATPLPETLSRALLAVLTRMPDPAFAQRLEKVYAAAAKAIYRLSDMDLLQYETTVVDGSADLSLWEEMAPVIRDTVVDVNALLSVIREEFPSHPEGGIADTLAQAAEEVGMPVLTARPEQRVRRAEEAVTQAAASLTKEIAGVGELMRDPNVVSDRWNLLAAIQAFRSRFREVIGELVYASAAEFTEAHRRDLVPGYLDEVNAAVLIRAAVADLTRVYHSRVERAAQAEPSDVQWYAQQLEKDLDAFGRTKAYRALRAQDKRQIIEFRHALGGIATRTDASRDELIEMVQPFSAFLESVAQVNKRELIVAHDREVWAAVGVKMERADQLLSQDPATAGKVLDAAAEEAQALYGRDAALDAFLRKSRKAPLSSLPQTELGEEMGRFRELIANFPLA